jgi:myo-inositol 2-dehydrogenase/D-chiro-inositol 1-dehydrogenase
MNSQKIKIGMIGAGMISGYHIAGLQAAGAEVAAIAGLGDIQAKERAEQFNIPFVTPDYEEILAQDDIAGVVVATPDFTHETISVAALEAGKPVLLQKPMARNSDECRRIIETSERTGTPLYVSFMHRYFEEVVKTKELLAENAFGLIYSVRQRNATPGASWAAWFYRKESVGGGAMLQLGVHGIDLLQYLFGKIKMVKAVTALMKEERVLEDGTIIRPDNEDLIFAIYRFDSGMMATHETVYNEVAGTDRFRMEIYGENGSAWLRTERGPLAIYAPEYLTQDGWFMPALPEQVHGYRQHRHFLDMVQNKAPDDGSEKAGLISVLVVEAIYRSAESGQWEEISQP